MENKKNEINKDIDQVSGGMKPSKNKLTVSSNARSEYGIRDGLVSNAILAISAERPELFATLGTPIGPTTKDVSERTHEKLEAAAQLASAFMENPALAEPLEKNFFDK